MFDATMPARTVAQWQGTLPAQLTDAIRVFEESEWAEPPVAEFPTDDVTPENVATRIADYATQLATAEAFTKAKTAAREALAGNVIRAAVAAAPAMMDALRPTFAAAAKDYRTAAALLPERITGDDIAGATEAVQAAYRTAVDAAATIAGIDGWLAGLTNLPGIGSYDHDKACRVVTPSNRDELSALLGANSKQPAEQKLHPMFLQAARLNIPFEMHTPAEATAIRKAIDATPVVQKRQWAKF